MKKLLTITLLLLFSISMYAQNDVTKFLGIPVTGTKTAMIQKLKAKGYTYISKYGYLTGEFNGRDVFISVVTNNNKVYRIMVADLQPTKNEADIIVRFNTLCSQFENNKRYVSTGDDFTIPEGEDIYHQMKVKNKRYEAVFYQKTKDGLIDGDISMRSVWFMISESYGEYSILMYYDNVYNQANGDDL